MQAIRSVFIASVCAGAFACSDGTTALVADAGLTSPNANGSDAANGGNGPADASNLSDANPGSAVDSGFSPILNPDGTSVFPTNAAGQVVCGTDACTCNDGEDNDGDGLVDGNDPECTGAYDDDESSFATGIPGDNKDPFQDCFFDGNSGGGADDCKIDIVCILDRESEECADSFKGNRTLESEEQKCEEFCEPRTPNGCDCFGCCEVFVSSTVSAQVLLDPSCEVELDAATGAAVVGDGCQQCTPSTLCANDCGECELCLGRSVEDLPAKCATLPPPDAGAPGETDAGSPPAGGGDTDPPGYQCLDGSGNSQPTCASEPCGAGWFCQNGCCVPQTI